MRKIIQIAAIPESEFEFEILFVLCEDGSVLLMREPTNTTKPRQWELLPELPPDN